MDKELKQDINTALKKGLFSWENETSISLDGTNIILEVIDE